MGYKKPFIPLMVTATLSIVNHTPIYSVSHLASVVVYHYVCFTEDIDRRISTEDSEYGYTWLPIWLPTTRWRQFRITGKQFTTCHSQRQSMWETHQWISSAMWVWLPSFTAAISRRSTDLSPVSIQPDRKFPTNQQCKARIWPALRWLWWVSNVPLPADSRTQALISRCAESASRTVAISSSQLTNIF